MQYTDDPVADFYAHDAEQAAWLAKRPKCCECDNEITEETLVEFNGECICLQCLKDNHIKNTEDFIF